MDPPIRCFSMLADFYQVSVDYLLGRTACANGVDAYKEPVLENYVVDTLVADVLSLNTMVVRQFLIISRCKKVNFK